MIITTNLEQLSKWMTLADTVPYMVSGDHTERLKAEILQLAIRINKLDSMLKQWDSLEFTPEHHKELYESQYKAMKEYLAILMRRVGYEFTL